MSYQYLTHTFSRFQYFCFPPLLKFFASHLFQLEDFQRWRRLVTDLFIPLILMRNMFVFYFFLLLLSAISVNHIQIEIVALTISVSWYHLLSSQSLSLEMFHRKSEKESYQCLDTSAVSMQGIWRKMHIYCYGKIVSGKKSMLHR